MSSVRCLIFLLIVLSGISCAGKSSSQVQYPTLTPVGGEADTVAFGNLAEGECAVAKFSLFNNDSVPVSILSVDSGCGCIVVDYPTKPVATQQTAPLSVTFYTDALAGEVLKRVSFTLAGAESPYVLWVTATVR